MCVEILAQCSYCSQLSHRFWEVCGHYWMEYSVFIGAPAGKASKPREQDCPQRSHKIYEMGLGRCPRGDDCRSWHMHQRRLRAEAKAEEAERRQEARRQAQREKHDAEFSKLLVRREIPRRKEPQSFKKLAEADERRRVIREAEQQKRDERVAKAIQDVIDDFFAKHEGELGLKPGPELAAQPAPESGTRVPEDDQVMMKANPQRRA